MDAILENKFLDNVARFQLVYCEDDKELHEDTTLLNQDNIEAKIYQTFVLESETIVKYMKSLLVYAVKMENEAGNNFKLTRTESEMHMTEE